MTLCYTGECTGYQIHNFIFLHIILVNKSKKYLTQSCKAYVQLLDGKYHTQNGKVRKRFCVKVGVYQCAYIIMSEV